MSATIHTGDCREVLRTLPDQSVHCCVTSPPYFCLRDYGVDGQIGLEQTPEEFVAELVAVFREVHRVLRDDGTLWLNLGDSYAGNGAAYGEDKSTLQGARQSTRMGAKRQTKAGPGLKPKDLIGIPWRVAFALQADGWYLRQDIIWHKPNPMPESVRDRCTKAHEYLFLLAKSAKPTIWRAADSGAWSNSPDLSERAPYPTEDDPDATIPRWRGHSYYFDQDAITEASTWDPSTSKMPDGWDTGEGGHGSFHRDGREKGKKYSFARETKATAGEHGQTGQHRPDREDIDYAGRRNKRSVWTVATQPFREAHFATYPVALIEPCILAGTPAGGTVLDPFGGAGTTAVAADQLGRDAVLIELNPEYAEIARRRLVVVQPGLALGSAA